MNELYNTIMNFVVLLPSWQQVALAISAGWILFGVLGKVFRATKNTISTTAAIIGGATRIVRRPFVALAKYANQSNVGSTKQIAKAIRNLNENKGYKVDQKTLEFMTNNGNVIDFPDGTELTVPELLARKSYNELNIVAKARLELACRENMARS